MVEEMDVIKMNSDDDVLIDPNWQIAVEWGEKNYIGHKQYRQKNSS